TCFRVRSVSAVPRASNRDPLYLVQRDLITGAVIKLGGPWALVRRHCLRVLKRTAGIQISSDARRPKRVVSDVNLQPRRGRSPLDHRPGVAAVHPFVGQRASAAGRGAEEWAFAVTTDPRAIKIG